MCFCNPEPDKTPRMAVNNVTHITVTLKHSHLKNKYSTTQNFGHFYHKLSLPLASVPYLTVLFPATGLDIDDSLYLWPALLCRLALSRLD